MLARWPDHNRIFRIRTPYPQKCERATNPQKNRFDFVMRDPQCVFFVEGLLGILRIESG
jgi:hypothetical protein